VTVLLLGGTAEARALAERLIGCDVSVLSSLAGRVARPRLPVGPVRIGGLGASTGCGTGSSSTKRVPWSTPRTPSPSGSARTPLRRAAA